MFLCHVLCSVLRTQHIFQSLQSQTTAQSGSQGKGGQRKIKHHLSSPRESIVYGWPLLWSWLWWEQRDFHKHSATGFARSQNEDGGKETHIPDALHNGLDCLCLFVQIQHCSPCHGGSLHGPHSSIQPEESFPQVEGDFLPLHYPCDWFLRALHQLVWVSVPLGACQKPPFCVIIFIHLVLPIEIMRKYRSKNK